MSAPSRFAEIRRRQSRQTRLERFRRQFQRATADRDREVIVEKAAKRGFSAEMVRHRQASK